MAEKLSMVSTTERLLADVADSLRKSAGRPRLVFAAADVTIPNDEMTPPAAKAAVKPPEAPAAASSPAFSPPPAAVKPKPAARAKDKAK